MTQLTLADFRKAQFLTSAARVDQCPTDLGVEVAFAGRSNAGKSSCINVLTDNKGLARTSKTPGRTQLINFFNLDNVNQRRLVDLPGYGYAKVSLAMKEEWQHHLEDYLRRRQSLIGLILLMDVRHPLKDFDVNMLNWAAQTELPVHCVLTKADKLKRGPANQALFEVQKALKNHANVSVQLFSSHTRQGVEQLAGLLADWMRDENFLTPEDVAEIQALDQALGANEQGAD